MNGRAQLTAACRGFYRWLWLTGREIKEAGGQIDGWEPNEVLTTPPGEQA
jgi:hypothetical protein